MNQDERYIDEEPDLEAEEFSGADGETEEAALYEHRRVVADSGQNPIRVDKFLMDHLPGTTRNRIQKAADSGYIQVAGKPVRSNYRVKAGDIVTLMLDRPKREWEIVPEQIPLQVVFEDSHLLVVNKPAGMVVHPGCGNFSGTLVNALAWHLKDDPRYDPNDPEVGLVHRIDKDTSGLLVVAKTPEAKTSLCKQFFFHTTRRLYNALVWGPFPQDDGTIRGNIARDPKDRLRMTVFPDGSEVGKPAVTHWHVLERYGPVTLLQCRLETGRTHQIRAHMKHLGHPLFADERYGGDQMLRGDQTASYKAFVRNCMEICPRQALHARTLGFRHPDTGEEMDFECDMAPDMLQLVRRWRKRAGITDAEDDAGASTPTETKA